MSWSYRIIEHDKDDPPWFAVHEVFYDRHSLSITGWTEDPASPGGETAKEVVRDLEMMLRDAREDPPLKESELLGALLEED